MQPFPTEESTFLFPGPRGHIEMLTTPAEGETNTTAIICHPHSLHGGSMQNKVVTTIARAFKDLGLRTVRFNFRGVGKTEGKYAEGIGETDDLIAIINWVKKTFPNDKIWLAGFSFGTYVATRASTKVQVAQLVCVAPAVIRFDFASLPALNCPCLVIQGDKDEVVAPYQVYEWVNSLSPKPTLIRMPDAGHFFHGKLLELRNHLEDELRARVG